MSGAQSRNRARKVAYAALADKGSRNQDSIGDQPIIGRFETVTEERWTSFDEAGNPVTKVRKVKPYLRIVHDERAPAAASPTKAVKRETDARKLRRQAFAWTNCRRLRIEGKHDAEGANCRSCGCPVEEQTP